MKSLIAEIPPMPLVKFPPLSPSEQHTYLITAIWVGIIFGLTLLIGLTLAMRSKKWEKVFIFGCCLTVVAGLWVVPFDLEMSTIGWKRSALLASINVTTLVSTFLITFKLLSMLEKYKHKPSLKLNIVSYCLALLVIMTSWFIFTFRLLGIPISRS